MRALLGYLSGQEYICSELFEESENWVLCSQDGIRERGKRAVESDVRR